MIAFNIFKRSFFVSLIFLFVGCGGGSGGSIVQTPAAETLSGTAAIGSPVAGGAINVMCAGGSALTPTTTSATGAWSVTLSGQSMPCVVQVSGGTIDGAANTTPYHSIANAIGIVNVTPITDLIVANAAGAASPSTWFSGLNSAAITPLTPTVVTAALAQVRTALGLTALNNINPLTVSFSPVSGNAMDDILTALQVAMTNQSVTLTALRTAASGATFTPPTGFSTAVNTAHGNTASGGTPAAVVPAAPSNPVATAAGASQINLSWSAVSNAVGYHVYRSTSASVAIAAANKLTTVPLTGLSYSSTGLLATTPYYYKVTAVNVAGESTGSIEMTATTGSASAVPAAPTNIVSVVISASQIDISWTPVNGATSYNVYRSTSTIVPIQASAKVNSSPVTAITFSNTGLSPLTAYYYAVTAVNSAGEGTASGTVMSGTGSNTGAPAAPALLTPIYATSATEVYLSWPSGGLSYNVYRSTTSGFTISPANKVGTPSANVFTDTGLTPNTNYYYKVTGFNGYNGTGLEGLPSPQGTATTTPANLGYTGSLMTPRKAHSAVLLANGKVLVAGGQNGTTELTSTELYDPATGIWTATGSLSAGRYNHTMTLLANGKVLIAGGVSAGQILAGAELYDPATGLWTATGNMTAKRGFFSTILLGNGKVLAVGTGYVGTAGVAAATSAELYDPAAGVWTAAASRQSASGANSSPTGMELLPNGNVFVTSGGLIYAQIYNPTTNVWSVSANMASNTAGISSTIKLADGKIMTAYSQTRAVEIYNPVNNTWTASGVLANMNHSTATVLTSGKVMFAGGTSGYSALADLYDPATSTWTVGPSMVGARYGQVAVKLGDGKILMIGGSGSMGTMNTCELYQSNL